MASCITRELKEEIKRGKGKEKEKEIERKKEREIKGKK
jgi:hypothetical protein